MNTARLVVEKDYALGNIDSRLYSSFIEHLGRAVYQGIYEPGHPTADDQGFRKDVIELVKTLNVPLIRYPGGNFLSGYNWRDGIGPKNERPVRLDLAWKTFEPNQIGIDEFYDWTIKAGTKIMGAVNMGTGTPCEAGSLLEYCNFPGGTANSDLRKKNGHTEPYNIKTWCIGNEMDGPWQTCHLDATDYGKKALETAKIMKWVDDSIELVVCGSSNSFIPTYPEWDRIVLEHTYDYVDYLSLHRYYENYDNDEDFLSSFVDMDKFIKTICGTADYVKACKRSKKTMYLSFDEWNVWYQVRQKPHNWQYAPSIIDDTYSLLDALVVGGLGITLINNSDRVRMACLAQLVNVIAPIVTVTGGPCFRQTIYWPFHDISKYGRGTAIISILECEKRETCHGDVPLITAAVVHNEMENMLTVFALNTDKNNRRELSLDVRSFGKIRFIEHKALFGENLSIVNSPNQPDAVYPVNLEIDKISSDSHTVILEKASWNVMRFELTGKY
jgi:alpha-N-arabinofuranosidase